MRTSLFKVAAALLCALSAAPLAVAHVHLVSSTPANGSVVASAPTTLVLHFSEAARVTALSIRKSGEAALQKIAPLPDGALTQLSIAAPTLGPGAYVVSFRALDPGDGHISGGTFRFSIVAHGAQPIRKDAMRDTGKRPAADAIK